MSILINFKAIFRLVLTFKQVFDMFYPFWNAFYDILDRIYKYKRITSIWTSQNKRKIITRDGKVIMFYAASHPICQCWSIFVAKITISDTIFIAFCFSSPKFTYIFLYLPFTPTWRALFEGSKVISSTLYSPLKISPCSTFQANRRWKINISDSN